VTSSRPTGVEVSRWLFLCTIFLALFLAFSKRRHEITLLAGSAAGQRPVLDHYSPAFLDQMINVVTASSVVSYALYAVSQETVQKYHTQDLVFTIPLVLYGIFRYLYLMYQRPGTRNPTEAILRDRLPPRSGHEWRVHPMARRNESARTRHRMAEVHGRRDVGAIRYRFAQSRQLTVARS